MRIATILCSVALVGRAAAQDTVINIDGAPFSFMLCPGNSADTSMLFVDSNAVESIALRFCSGTLEEDSDLVYIYDGMDNTAPLLFAGSGAMGQMTDVLAIATSPAIYLEVFTNGSLSCADQSYEALVAVAFPSSMGMQDCQFAAVAPATATPLTFRVDPIAGQLRVNGPAAAMQARASVLDATGRTCVATARVSAGEPIHIGALPAGSYMLVLTTDQDRPMVGRFVISR